MIRFVVNEQVDAQLNRATLSMPVAEKDWQPKPEIDTGHHKSDHLIEWGGLATGPYQLSR